MPELPPTLLCRGPDWSGPCPRDPALVNGRVPLLQGSHGVVASSCPCHQQREWCRRTEDRCMFDIKRHATSSRNRRPVYLGDRRRCPQRSLVHGGNYAVGAQSCSPDLPVESSQANVTCALGICPSLGCRIFTTIMPLIAECSARILETGLPKPQTIYYGPSWEIRRASAERGRAKSKAILRRVSSRPRRNYPPTWSASAKSRSASRPNGIDRPVKSSPLVATSYGCKTKLSPFPDPSGSRIWYIVVPREMT